MNTRSRALWATTALFTGMLVAGAASAQSTGTEAAEATVEEVVVTGTRGPRTTDGTIIAETVAKTRSSVTQEFIGTQQAGQTILQTLNLTPGLNFTNNDPYGSSGGNIRLRGFDGNRISLTFDGIPLNDTGNYAVFSNQQIDAELIERASVNTGTTDVDSPTASATGGTINYQTRRPGQDFGGFVVGSLGDFGYRRVIGVLDSGEIGPWGTTAFASYSYQKYDKFKGIGELEKKQFNARIYQPLGDNGDFIALSGHYNENRNNSYLGPNLRTSTGSLVDQVVDPTNPFGWNIDANRTYLPYPAVGAVAASFTPRAGVADVDPAANSAYWGLRINPSNTGNIRGNSKFSFGDKVILTIDPSFQYVQANGGTQNTNLSERDAILRGQIGAAAPTVGIDLNGDGDTLDSVRVMNPSNTVTHRYGLNSSLIWNVTDDHQVRVAYTGDYGRHRQSGAFGRVDFTNPQAPVYVDEFGGLDDLSNRIVNRDGYFLRSRDRKSIAQLNQIAAEYVGNFMNDALRINVGARFPFFERELNQYCFTQNNSGNVRCTSETPNATLANGNVTFAGVGTGTGAAFVPTQFIAPYSRTLKYDDILPAGGVLYRFADYHSVYASYAKGFSAPRTDSLYTVTRLADGSIGNPTVVPETTDTFDVGYRFQMPNLIASAALFQTSYQDRIVSSFDQDLGFFVDRNVGDVESYGGELSVSWEPIEALSLYASASFIESELQENLQVSATAIALTKGKEVVETPDQSYAIRASYQFNDVFAAGVQAKYVGKRWITDVNDLEDDAYTTVDLDARFDFATFGLEGTWLQVNVLNVTDEDYYGSLGTTTSATPGAPGFSRPFAQVGAPRTVSASIRYSF